MTGTACAAVLQVLKLATDGRITAEVQKYAHRHEQGKAMKKFELTSDMLTMGGVFYPRGYAFVMFPSAEAASQVADELEKAPGLSGKAMLLNPSTVMRQIGKLEDENDSDVELPSVGTEGATVQKYVRLARAGHHALMLPVDSDDETETLMQAARKADFSYAQRYQLLAMQDLE